VNHDSPLSRTKIEEITSRYRDIETKFEVRSLHSEISYVSPVNFVESSNSPRHRWFPYKEGFSPSFVRSVVEEACLEDDAVVLDPFSGVGSTCITVASMGYHSLGIEISPLANFVAKAKCLSNDQLDEREFSKLLRTLDSPRARKSVDPPENETVRSYFHKEIFEAILEVKRLIADTKAPESTMLKLALLANLEMFSTHRRAGNGVKRKSKPPAELTLSEARVWVGQLLANSLRQMIGDIVASPLLALPEFRTGSSLSLRDSADLPAIGCVVTSPPYPNCFDYSKIYQRELWIGDFLDGAESLKRFRNDSVQSHVHSTWTRANESSGSEIVDDLVAPYLAAQEMWSPKIPGMLRGYFKDMSDCLLGISKKLPSGAFCNFVVGNAHYSGIPVPTDLLLAELSTKFGYSVERIDVYRRIVPSAQYIRSGADLSWARESNVILRKD
jgi:hypothetical protein